MKAAQDVVNESLSCVCYTNEVIPMSRMRMMTWGAMLAVAWFPWRSWIR